MPPDPQPNQPPWYVALVQGGEERKAEAHLRAVGFTETFCPRRVVRSTVRGKPRERHIAVASGYVLCTVDTFTPDLWHRACPAEGLRHHGLVRGFIGGWPVDPVPSESIDEQRSFCDEAGVWLEKVPIPDVYEPGTAVRVSNPEHPAFGHVFTVVWGGSKTLNLRAVHWRVDRLSIEREHVERLVEPRSPTRAEQASRSPENGRALRQRNRMRRGGYGVLTQSREASDIETVI